MRNEIVIRAEPQRAFAVKFIQDLKINPDKPLVLTVEPYKKRRSLSQNALMWSWLTKIVDAISQHTGHDTDELHSFFKSKYLPARTVEIGGEVRQYYTTTKLTTAEMTAYLDKIYAFATQELGLLLPLPEELGRGES